MSPQAALLALAVVGLEPPPDYDRDVRPILSESCFRCHGFDEKQRKAKLRLDTKEGSFRDLGGGALTIDPGTPQESEIYLRITSDDPAYKMPPPDSGQVVTPQQAEILRRWIEAGAAWSEPWSLRSPARPALPSVADASKIRTPIDAFVVHRLEPKGFAPAPEADRAQLARRLHQDLLGLPPTPAALDEFLADQAPDAYERLVERLLASPHHGEKLALLWLDLVRYADTDGYHADNYRSIWPYRDWVINAFNVNMPFDRFTRDQLAGDLIPDATEDQKIASGYNKLLMTTEEGGAQPKEYTAKYAADRVRNVSGVWLGATLGCAECHDHKYDPLTTKDFYALAAFFADVKENAVGKQDPYILASEADKQALRRLDDEIAQAQKSFDARTPERDAAQAVWEREAAASKPDGLPPKVKEALAVPAEKRTKTHQNLLSKHFADVDPARAPIREALAKLTADRTGRASALPTTLVSVATPPRMTRILPRGNWLDDSGAEVTPAVPAAFGALPGPEARPNRLELARWLTARENPRVARVMVNRLWKLMFGQGLIATTDDFGAQGTPPTHPELLDWLAVEFVESGWDVRHILRLIARSHTYRQSSAAPHELRDRDPRNQWLARQGRFRLDAELVRDGALAMGGLLVPAVGGPSVKPYQPRGYWQFLNFPKREWDDDGGEKLYRRGLYTFWCRTFLHPSLLAFDAPTREECTVDRPRTNTPLQALALLNDPTYVEAARAFAERIVREGGASDAERAAWAFRVTTSRAPQPEEAAVLVGLVAKHRSQYAADRNAAEAMLKVGARPRAQDLDPIEVAAWTSAARALFNLHETITRS